MRDLTHALTEWIAGGGREVGEVCVERLESGFALHHRDEAPRTDAAVFAGAEAARDLAQFDDEGKFRPLKTAPNLRHGWHLQVSGPGELRRALDYFYPAMLGVWFSQQKGRLHPVPLRETLARQTGMYAVTRKVTDVQAQAMIGDFCRTEGGCLKRILWTLAPGEPVTSLPPGKFETTAPADTLPLLCHEACNLLVARTREVVKKSEVKP